MATAGLRLWRRSPLWRGALILAMPLSALAWFHPPVWQRVPVRPVMSDAAGSPTMSLAAPAPLPAPTAPTAPPVEGAAMLARLEPFYGSRGLHGMRDQASVAAQEVHLRPIYTSSAPFMHREIPLPPGAWTVVSLDQEYQTDGSLAAQGVLLVRLDQHTVTGAMMLRSSNPDAPKTANLAPNPYCRPGRTLLVTRLPAAGGDACWFIGWPVPPNLVWPLADLPPAARRAVRTLAATGDRLPMWLFGATYFRSDGRHWVEVSYYFDPGRNGVVPTGADGRPDPMGAPKGRAMAELMLKLKEWMRLRVPLLDEMGPEVIEDNVAAGLNLSSPR